MKYLIVAALAVLLHAEEPAEEVNYCKDPEAVKEWQELADKYPEDRNIIVLHALHVGFCAKIEHGDITIDRATELFEQARSLVIQGVEEQNRQEARKEKKKI